VIPAPESNPDALFELFGRHREVHPYGLADLEEPFWSSSAWFRRGAAAVGVIDLADAELAIVYAVSSAAAAETAALVGDLAVAGELPARFLLTGPVGIEAALTPAYRAMWCGPHTRMRLADHDAIGPSPEDVESLGHRDLPAIEALFAAAPDAGRFFTPSMLDTRAYVGRYVDDALIAMAGVHVLSERHRVAAIGNLLTHPAHRGRGHAAELMRSLCRRLVDRVDVIGLNVSDDNIVARRLYDRLGFTPVIAFDEGEFVARRP
jgi:GNAT superfamily N-acetyltransferase